MFEGFERRRLHADGMYLNVAIGGTGPPIVLLHGYPQTHVCWHRVAPLLAGDFTVVCPDLRGYGDSDKPASEASHRPYSKRAMARDVAAIMSELGFENFHIAGHDRGGRVARRLALDFPQQVLTLSLLDIVPTSLIYKSLDQARATAVWRYLFLIQPFDLPESLISASRETYLRWTLDSGAAHAGR